MAVSDEEYPDNPDSPRPPTGLSYAAASFAISDLIESANLGDLDAMEFLRELGVEISDGLRHACFAHEAIAHELAADCDVWPYAVRLPLAAAAHEIKRTLEAWGIGTRLNYRSASSKDARQMRIPAALSMEVGTGLADYLRRQLQDDWESLVWNGAHELKDPENEHRKTAIQLRDSIWKERKHFLRSDPESPDELLEALGLPFTPLFFDIQFLACLLSLTDSPGNPPKDWAMAGIAWLERECGAWIIERRGADWRDYRIRSPHVSERAWATYLESRRPDDPVVGFYNDLLDRLTKGFKALAFRPAPPA